MNNAILKQEVQDFISEKLNDQIHEVVLKGSPFPTISIQELAEQIVSKQKCISKLPTWFHKPGIYFPPGINIEQSSSELTAQYKASLIKGKLLLDLTGGFGVDSYFFSQKVNKVIYCEHNSDLAQIAAHNFECLDQKNIEIFKGDGLSFLNKTIEPIDWIYLDPSRRHTKKGKVFLLEDCEPDIVQHSQFLLSKSDAVLLKTSPLLDLSVAINSLKHIHEIHIVAVQNEVKELLFLLKTEPVAEVEIIAINLLKKGQQKFRFKFPDQNSATLSKPLKYMYEPNAAILKSGAFNTLANHLNISKLHKHSHLYTSSEIIDFPGRRMKIKQVLPYNRKLLKKNYPFKKGNISTRNFPESVAQIRKKTGITDGGDNYLFFTTDQNEQHIVIICEKV